MMIAALSERLARIVYGSHEDLQQRQLARTDGYGAHERVPMSSWCVTRGDLRTLRAAVKKGVGEGNIVPTEKDDFDPVDDKYGPSIYTVVRHLIKPVSQMAGGHSWALIRHPDGLQCDLFVTHCWKEGVYEFIDKVVHSWPRGARHAYCCFLSNPQTLDIKALIASPAESPFAKALLSADCMLVVPNRHCSIYSRIWCVYEAFLGYKWHKKIIIAKFPITRFWTQLFLVCMLAFPSAAFSFIFFLWYPELLCRYLGGDVWYLDELGFYGVRLLILVSLFLGWNQSSPALRLINYAGALISSHRFGTALSFLWQDHRRDQHPFPPKCAFLIPTTDESMETGVHFVLTCGFMLLFFLAGEADRMRMAATVRESALLREGFTGQCCDAKSSSEEDRENILQDIKLSGGEQVVDQTIDILLRAGMSTANLKIADEHGVNIDSAGHFRISLALYGWGGFVTHCLEDFACTKFRRPHVLSVLGLVEAVAWLVLMVAFPADARSFAARTTFKVFFIPFGIGRNILPGSVPVSACPSEVGYFMGILLFTLSLACSAAGLGRLVSVPIFGPPAARFIMANNLESLYCWCCTIWNRLATVRHGTEMQPIHDVAAEDGTEVQPNRVISNGDGVELSLT